MHTSHVCLPRTLGAVLRPLSGRSWAVPLHPSHHRKAVVWSRAMDKDSHMAMVHKHAESMQPKRPVLLFDVMDTVVYDPFFKEMPVFFQMSFQDLLRDKHPTAWVDFECGRIDEEHLCRIFFADGRSVDRQGLTNMLRTHYRFLDGMEPLLTRLSLAGYEMHALSNYPVWWNMIEDKLRLSRFMQWSFVSCTGPMKGVRKPVPEAYQRVIDHLALPPEELLFIDDRKPNIQGAEAQGLPSVLFANAAQLEGELMARGLKF